MLLGDVAAAALPIVDAFAAAFDFIGRTKAVLVPLVGVMTALAAAAGMFAAKAALGAAKSIIKAAAETFGSFAGIPFGIGIPLAIGAVASLYSLMRSAPDVPKMAQGGIVKPRPGGTLATIGEAGQPEAVIPLNKAKQMGFGGGGSAQPVIIQNNWDAFAASSGRGRRGLGGTQELQASPTFA